jgi:hypothetical protein
MNNSRAKKVSALTNAVVVFNEEDGQHNHLYLPLLVNSKHERHDRKG